MAHLMVMTFDNTEEAMAVRKAIKKQQKAGYVSLNDSAVIVKDDDGKIHVKNQMDRGVRVGAVTGGFIGLLISSVFFPVTGMVLGVLGGMGVGALTDIGIEKSFVKKVASSLSPRTSALFLLVRNSNPDAAIATLRPFKGHLHFTSLDSERAESVRGHLSERR